MITARDICPYCSHLWDEHTENPPETPYHEWVIHRQSFWRSKGGWETQPSPCKCCLRVAREVTQRNAGES